MKQQAFWFQHILTQNSIYSPSQRVLQIHTRVLESKSQASDNLYTCPFSVTSLGRGLLAEHQGMKGLSRRWRGNRIYRWKWSVLGRFFCRTVDSRVGELLIKCGVPLWNAFDVLEKISSLVNCLLLRDHFASLYSHLLKLLFYCLGNRYRIFTAVFR